MKKILSPAQIQIVSGGISFNLDTLFNPNTPYDPMPTPAPFLLDPLPEQPPMEKEPIPGFEPVYAPLD